MITILVHILIAALILGVLLWAAGQIPPLAPFLSVIRIVIIVLFVIWIVLQLMPLAGLK